MPSSFAAAVRLKRVLLERLEDRLAFDAIEVLLQRPLGVRDGWLVRERRRRELQIFRLNFIRAGEREGALEHVLELAHVPGKS